MVGSPAVSVPVEVSAVAVVVTAGFAAVIPGWEPPPSIGRVR